MSDINVELFKDLFKIIKEARKTVRALLESHLKQIPHDTKRKELEIEKFSEVIDVITKKWCVQILWELEIHGGLFFNEMKRHLDGVSTRALSDALKKLEEFQLITRTVQDSRPPKVLYDLNNRGKGFIEISLLTILYLMKF